MLNYCANGPSGYNLTNSLRFRQSASAYLNRTFTTPTNGKIWTLSIWLKRGALGSLQSIMTAQSGGNEDSFAFLGGDTIRLFFSAYSTTGLITNAVFRDPSAWYHIVLAIDTTQATASNRVKMYVNGVQQTFTGSDYPAQNATPYFNTALPHYIARYANQTMPTGNFDGYNTEINFIDGQALTPSSFGSTNSTTGVWQPAKYSGSYGTNGFYLPFSPNATSSYAAYSSNLNANYNSLPTTGLGTNFQFTGDFTIEGWVLYPTSGADGSLYVIGTSTYLALNIDTSSGNYNIYTNTSTPAATFASGIPLNEWTHVAMVRSGSTITLYTNGVPKGTLTNSSTLGYATSVTYNRFGGDTTIARYTSNFRIVKSAVYTSKFVPPTAPLTSIANTLVLTFQNSSAIDNSPNAWTVSTTGTVTYPVSYPFTANIAADASGNANNWTPNNIQVSTSTATTYDSMTDVPTLTSATVANYAVLNPLDNGGLTISQANMSISRATTSWVADRATFGVSSGKWYWEYTSGASGLAFEWIGIGNASATLANYVGVDANGYAYNSFTGNKINSNSGAGSGVAYGATYTSGDVIGVALDMDAGTITFYKNNTSQGTAYTGLSGTFFPMFSQYGTLTGYANFGQRPFTYTPPTGYVALNTYNLPTSTIVQGNKYMDAITYAGDGTSPKTFSGWNLRPDFIWTKSRNVANDHGLIDSSRGTAGQYLNSNTTNSEWSAGAQVTSFNATGYTVATGSSNFTWANQGSTTYVAWAWNANNGTTSSNTNGSITSTVQVNASAGFSIVTYTGTGANATVGHGLGVAPKFIVVKNRSNGSAGWYCYHASLTSASYAIFLNATNAQTLNTAAWNATAPTSTVFSLGTEASTNTSSMVAYCWAEIAGFSKFGSYTGNGSADGVFIYTGFFPKFIIIKSSSNAYNWQTYDLARGLYNANRPVLYPNLNNTEYSVSTNDIDFVANGFKLRGSDAGINSNGATYIYMAFATNPFKNSNAF